MWLHAQTASGRRLVYNYSSDKNFKTVGSMPLSTVEEVVLGSRIIILQVKEKTGEIFEL